MKHIKFYILIALSMFTLLASAQCTFHNTSFQSGEILNYNLYYNWKFVWLKAGTASWHTVASTYNGIPAYRASLTTRGNGKLDSYYVLRDTLLCYDSKDLAPLYFRKGAREGKRYTVDEVFYNYNNGKTHIRQHYMNNKGEHHWQNHAYEDCVFDMMSIFLRARSFNPEGWKEGYVVKFPLVDGDGRHNAQIIYRGKKNIKGDDGHKYRCLGLSYKEFDKGKWKEVARFYVTDDANHVPVRLDMYLKFGSAKAFLVKTKGLRSAATAIIK